MKEWVLLYADASLTDLGEGKVLLVEKNRPEWQAGRYNLLGGKVEHGESWQEASLREFYEEAGIQILDKTEPRKYGEIVTSGGKVHCVKVFVPFHQPKPRDHETEIVSWFNWNKVSNCNKLIPNLRVIIPLMVMGVRGWVISDELPSLNHKHSFMFTSYPNE
jgi:8-oxo-dGTP pyrophosphatase MutT (NUDIX family)